MRKYNKKLSKNDVKIEKSSRDVGLMILLVRMQACTNYISCNFGVLNSCYVMDRYFDTHN